MHDSVAKGLIATVYSNTPEFFEHLVLDVLAAMGYGADHRGAFKHNGQSHDGGKPLGAVEASVAGGVARQARSEASA